LSCLKGSGGLRWQGVTDPRIKNPSTLYEKISGFSAVLKFLDSLIAYLNDLVLCLSRYIKRSEHANRIQDER
jgi:hypothetical protein